MKDCNILPQKNKGAKCYMRIKNMKIIGMIWRIESQLLKVRFVRY